MAKKKKTKRPASKSSSGKVLTIEWPVELGVSQFANNVVIQSDENTSYLSFYQINPPLIFGTSQQKKKQLDSLKSIQPKLVASIAVPREKIQVIIEALQTQLINSDEDDNSVNHN